MLHGVKFVLLLHFAVNVFLITEAIGLVFFPQGSWTGSKSLGFEVAVAGYCLAGLAIIAAAFWGVVTKTEVYIRVYLLYLLLSLGIDVYFLMKIFVLSGPCEGIPEAFKEIGQSFICGIAQVVDGGIVAVALSLQLYFVYVVWSFAEDLACGGAADFADLLVDEEVFMKKRLAMDPYSMVLGPAGSAFPAEYGAVYDTAAVDTGMPASTRLFNGTRHEMMFPPPRTLSKASY